MSVFDSIPEPEWLASNSVAFAVLDEHPVTPGHGLVVSRRAISTWWDADRAEQIGILELVDELKEMIDLEHGPDGYNVGFDSGVAAGQTVDHLHVHVIPRYLNDVEEPAGGVRGVIPAKANFLVPDAPSVRSALVVPNGTNLSRELKRCFLSPHYDHIDLAVSFVMQSGVGLLGAAIDEALERGARIRILATDYLLISDAGALGFFLDRLGPHASGGSLDARVFSDPGTSYHPKAYLFSSGAGLPGAAFVGSSNLSRSGLRDGIEWNLESNVLGPLLNEFGRLWEDRRSIELTATWLDSYRARAEEQAQLRQDQQPLPTPERPEEPIRPWSVQQEALGALAATRLEGHRAGLVVMATGLGKTWLAGFDSTRPGIKRVLFVAHREEILNAARDVYRRIRPGGSFTRFTGGERKPGGDVVFASIQSLSRNLDVFRPDAFDYIVVDEFHHAAAPTYRKVLGHFEPEFMLGLTATPDRTDAADLLALCGDNLVYECGLVKGLERQLLSPFRYRAIKDVADYAEIPWRNGRFDPEELSVKLETQRRAQQVLDEWRSLGGPERRALAFCCSIRHADFMAEFFMANGVGAVSVHTAPSSADRSDSLEQLEVGALDVVFSVDLFNEGVDLPAVDLVMMLRPTESPVVFFQQLGRGLRRLESKGHLEVLDLVGNHRSFLMKARLLALLAGMAHLTDREAVALLKEPLTDLPAGCSIIVEPEAVDLLERLLGQPTRQDRLAELARAWVDDHEGVRPRALELAMVTKQAHDVKKAGGWFGFLDGLGLLDEAERAVAGLAGDLLKDVEHGAYTKSYKLVTLQAILDMGTLYGGSTVPEIALAARWRVFRDPRLMVDLRDATSQFSDVSNPTPAEWARYWTRNPINALIGGNKASGRPWFSTDGDRLVLDLDVPSDLRATFEAMLGEVVEYRLYRYLLGQESKRLGERLQPVGVGGLTIDAGFYVEPMADSGSSILFESAGGAGKTGKKRNPDYVAGIDAVLEQLKGLNAVVVDAYVDSTRTRDLPVADRRLNAGDVVYPIDLAAVPDVTAIRRDLLKSMAGVGRSPGVKKTGGNSRKALRLVLDGVDYASLIEVVAPVVDSGRLDGRPPIGLLPSSGMS